MRIVRYLGKHLPWVMLVMALLCVQAYCDLSLPTYTSDIVDIGIQQSGITHAATDTLSVETYETVLALSTDDERSILQAAYSLGDDGLYHLTCEDAQRAEVDAAITYPLVITAYASQYADGYDVALLLQTANQDASMANYLAELSNQAREQLSSMGDSIVSQQAIAAAKAEYDALGISTSDIQMSYLTATGGSMLCMALLGMACAALVALVSSIVGARIGRDLRVKLFSNVVALSDAEIGGFSAASLITRGTNDIQLIQNVCIVSQRMVLYAPILAIGGILNVARTNASMSWVIIAAIAFVCIVLIILFKVTMPKFKAMQKLIDRVNLVSREILTGMPSIRAYGRQAYEEQRFERASRDLMVTQLFTNRAMSLMMPFMMLAMNAVSVLIIWVGGFSVNDGTMQTGDLIAFITYSMVIIAGFLMIGVVAVFLPRANVAAERVDEVIAAKPSIVDGEGTLPEDAKSARGVKITFDDVTFAYEEGSEPALSHMSFTVEPGQTLALIGPTGCGKSTVVKLIERFRDVSGGRILIDGMDIRNITLKELHESIAYAPQQAFLFSGSVRSNVAYSLEATDESVERALDVAQAAEFVSERDGGVDSAISQGATNVSGGQRQRLSIARALASGARGFLFDDSFSALDYKTDALVRSEMAQQLTGRTIVIVAQRIATIKNADVILVLDEGSIVGSGTHAKLLKECPVYRDIALSQLSSQELELEGGDDDAR